MRLKLRHLLLLSAAIPAFAPTVAIAQNLPSSADPSRFEKRYTPNLTGESHLEAIQESDVDIGSQIPEAPDGFMLNDIVLEGITAFPKKHFDPLIAEYTGRKVDPNALNHLAARITAKYREEGYFLSKAIIPQQEVIDGKVRLIVLEGYVHEVTVDDPENLLRYDGLSLMQENIKKIKNLDPLHGPTLERIILLINDNPAVSVNSVIASAKDSAEPGAINITLLVKKKSPVLSASYNNFGSRFIGPHQTSALANLGGVLNTYDSLLLTGTTTIPTKEVKYGQFAYTLPIHSNGLKFSVNLSYSDSHPGSTLRALDVEGDSTSASFSLVYPVIRSRRENLNIGIEASMKNTSVEFLDQELIDDKVRFVTLSTEYEKQTLDGSNRASLSLHKGLPLMEATKTGDPKASRSNGRSDFFKVEAAAYRIQNLPNNFDFLAQIEGQYSAHALLSSQEFGYGGGGSLGQAYDPSEITGDHGIAAGAELSYGGLPPIENLVAFRPFAFYDVGKTWDEGEGLKPLSAASAGFGTYYNINNVVTGSATLAYPLTRSVSTPVHGGSDGPRFLFELDVRF